VQLNGQTVANYSYNALGERIGKVATSPQAVNELYAYDEAGHLIGEYGTTNRDYVWLGNIPVAVVDNTINGSVTVSTFNYVTVDQLGTPRAVTNSAGTVIWQLPYQGNPFGEKQPTSSSGFVLNLRFGGQYYDAESGTNYDVNRTYCAACGRYQESDPIGLAGGISTYAYVGGDPLSSVDPLGLACPANLKAAGTCIDSSNFNPANSDGNTVAGTAETDEVAILNMRSLDTSDTDEHYASVTDTDSFLPATGLGKVTSKGYTGKFRIDTATTQAICHSHPRGREYWPTPGFGDNDALGATRFAQSSNEKCDPGAVKYLPKSITIDGLLERQMRHLSEYWKPTCLLLLIAIFVVGCADLSSRPEVKKLNPIFSDASGMIGQRVSIEGYLRYELENENLFPVEEARTGIKKKSCLPILIDNQKKYLIEAAAGLNGSIVIIKGVIVNTATPGMVTVNICKSVGIDVDSIKGA